MPTSLLESNFITTNLSSLRSRSRSQTQTNGAVSSNVNDINWAQWETEDLEAKLKERLESNKKLGANAKRDFEVESSFFNEFYINVWGKDIAKQLASLGELLRKAIKSLGYNRSTNPILRFLCNDYVKNELIRPGLINVNTFKAIYNVVAKELMPDDELSKDNNYNLIYCKALYRKPSREILDYLILQKDIIYKVSKNAQKYQALNKKIFIQIQKIDSKSTQQIKSYAMELQKMPAEKIPEIKNADLNTYELAAEVKKELMPDAATVEHNKVTRPTQAGIDNLVSQLDSPAKLLAVLTMVVTTTGNEQAKRLMGDSKFEWVSAKSLAAASREVAPLIMNKLDKGSMAALVQAISDKINES